MKFSIGLEPLVWRAVLMLLEVGDKVIEDIDKVIFEAVVANKAFRPYTKARASLRNVGTSDRYVNEPCGKEGVKFSECVLELRARVE